MEHREDPGHGVSPSNQPVGTHYSTTPSLQYSITPLRRWLQAGLFVALWMALGWGLRLDGEGYLLLGVPLTLAFQLGIRRQPVRALWVRGAPPFRLTARGWLIGAVLA